MQSAADCKFLYVVVTSCSDTQSYTCQLQLKGLNCSNPTPSEVGPGLTCSTCTGAFSSCGPCAPPAAVCCPNKPMCCLSGAKAGISKGPCCCCCSWLWLLLVPRELKGPRLYRPQFGATRNRASGRRGSMGLVTRDSTALHSVAHQVCFNTGLQGQGHGGTLQHDTCNHTSIGIQQA